MLAFLIAELLVIQYTKLSFEYDDDFIGMAALQRLQCLRLRGSETWVPHWAGILQDWPDNGAVETQQIVSPAIFTTRYFREFPEVAKFAK